MSGGAVEIRDDPPQGAAARALFAEYMEFLRERLDLPVLPAHVFASEDVFAGDGAWLVAFDAAGAPLGCGGLRVLAPGVAEIKRMYVSPRVRGTGVGRRLLRELEGRAGQGGVPRVRLLTTELLTESRALYASEGYGEIERIQRPGEPVEIWLEKRLQQPTTRRRRGPAAGRAAARHAAT